MNQTSEDVKDMLEADSSLGLIFNENLFINRQPITPTDTTTIFDTWGRPPAISLSGENYYYPSIQIEVRSISERTASILINKIANSLHGRAHETWNGTLYTVITQTSEPVLLDWDDNGLVRFVINFNLQRR